MTDYRREQLENWVGEFCGSDLTAPHLGAVQAGAAPLLVEFLAAAREHRRVELFEIEADDAREGMLKVAGKFKLPETVARAFPDLCALLLEHLESQGRLSGGRSMGMGLKTYRGKLNKPQTIVRPGTKVARNEPCPCGSGKKYKKCCMNLLS